MTLIVTSNYALNKVATPNLPVAPEAYSQQYISQLNNVLRLYFNQLNNIVGQLVASNTEVPISFPPTALDAFGRQRVSQPYTLFDSQNRYAADNQFDSSTTGTGSTTFNTNQASVSMSVTAGGVGSVARQTYRSFPYQPGKGLLVLATFVMDSSTSANLTQRVGYFNSQNGVFFQKLDGTNSFVLRTNTSGTPSDARTVNQADWNGDKLDGTGASGYTLDLTHPQILWMDFEWLGVGSVRCGFIINGEYIVCHTFNTANVYGTTVYMTTAILPVRYEITSTSALAATLTQICCSVVSEGGFEQTSIDHVARRTTIFNTIDTAATFYPIVSIRLASGRTGAVVLPNRVQFLPTTSQNYEVVLLKNPTLTGATWAATVPSDSNVEYDVAATAISAVGTIVQTDYVTSSGSGGVSQTSLPNAYNWDLQLGATIAGVSDIYTLAVRTVSGATTGDGLGSISFYDLTQ